MLRLFNKKHWEIVRNGKFEINGQQLENLYAYILNKDQESNNQI